jgi:quinol monooxygenase YgiN
LEPGCLHYEFYQSTDDPLAFAFIETWRSSADLERHLASPHLQGVLLQAMGLISGAPEITQWNAVR